MAIVLFFVGLLCCDVPSWWALKKANVISSSTSVCNAPHWIAQQGSRWGWRWLNKKKLESYIYEADPAVVAWMLLNQSNLRPRSEPALELHSRTTSIVGVMYRSSGPNIVSNFGGGRIQKNIDMKQKLISEIKEHLLRVWCVGTSRNALLIIFLHIFSTKIGLTDKLLDKL